MLLKILPGIQATPDAYTSIYVITTLILPVFLAAILIGRTGNASMTRRKLKNLRKIGLSTSNMVDQYDSQFDVPEGAAINKPIRVKAIYIHPVKSCAPIEVDRAQLTKTGFLYDRCCAIAIEDKTRADEKSSGWRFLSQRTKPNMSLIKTELWLPHKNSDPKDSLVQTGGCIVLSFPDPEPLSWKKKLETFLETWSLSTTPEVLMTVPLQFSPAQIKEHKIGTRTFDILGRNASGLDIGNVPSISKTLPSLRKFLNISKQNTLTIMKCTPDNLTRTDTNLAPLQHIGTPSVHGYTDDQPININNLSSVHAVSALLPPENQPLNALRFRANIWIDGAPAFEEETWKRCRFITKRGPGAPRVKVAPTLSVVCRSSRCTMPNVDPKTGTFDASKPPPNKKKGKPQPSSTLVEFRTVENANKAALGYIGMHAVPEDSSLKEAEKQEEGLFIEVGDEIEVLERGNHLHGSTANEY